MEFVDLQGVLDETDFCETVLRKLGESGSTLRDLKRALADRKLILLLDEVERLAEEDFSPRLHDLLRSLAQESHFAMCLATERPLEEVFPTRTPGGVSPFYNIFTVKSLGPYTRAEARGLDCRSRGQYRRIVHRARGRAAADRKPMSSGQVAGHGQSAV